MTGSNSKDTPSRSLSTYFPKGTVYFYGSPSAGHSGFFGNIPDWYHDLVAARVLVCAGSHVAGLVFATSITQHIQKILQTHLGIPLPDRRRIIALPHRLSTAKGTQRNSLLQRAIASSVPRGRLIMANPLIDSAIKDRYGIPPETLRWFNDKANMAEYIPAEELPRRYARYDTGKAFASDDRALPLPCVVKVVGSASGTGIRICTKTQDLARSKKEFKRVRIPIIVEQYIKGHRNLCIQFGIPADPKKPIEIIGGHEQLVRSDGHFLGGIFDPQRPLPGPKQLYTSLLSKILPNVRARGWYGVGGLDVLVTKSGAYYWIDPNFRMTATMASIFQGINGQIEKPIATFSATFNGTSSDFIRTIVPHGKLGSPDQLINIISLVRRKNIYYLNGGLLFEKKKDIPNIARRLLKLGLRSAALRELVAYRPQR
jgi:hypothetical protein